MEYQIEMLWKCKSCNNINKGLEKHCSECGKPKTDKEEEFFPDDISEKNALTGTDKSKALSGPDWKCKYCSSLQAAYKKFCSECGSEKESGSKEWQAEEKTITEFEGKKTITSQEVKIIPQSNPRKKPKAKSSTVLPKNQSKQKLKQPKEYVPGYGFQSSNSDGNDSFELKENIESFKRFNKSLFLKIAAGLGIFSLLIWFLFLFFSTRPVEVIVTNKKWERTLTIEKYTLVSKEGWYPSLDSIDVISLGSRVHHYDKVQDGSHTEYYTEKYQCGEDCKTTSGTCSTKCSSNKNGTANCKKTCSSDKRVCRPEYCTRKKSKIVVDWKDVPIYQSWFAWKEYEWIFYENLTSSGNLEDPYWKDYPNDPLYRANKSEHYEISFMLKDSKDVFSKKFNENEFMKINLNQKCTGFINGFSSLKDVICK